MKTPKRSRRDVCLLWHMTSIISLFVTDRSFINIVTIISLYMKVDINLIIITLFFSKISSLSIVFDLFLYKHELRQYLQQKLRPCHVRPQHWIREEITFVVYLFPKYFLTSIHLTVSHPYQRFSFLKSIINEIKNMNAVAHVTTTNAKLNRLLFTPRSQSLIFQKY